MEPLDPQIQTSNYESLLDEMFSTNNSKILTPEDLLKHQKTIEDLKLATDKERLAYITNNLKENFTEDFVSKMYDDDLHFIIKENIISTDLDSSFIEFGGSVMYITDAILQSRIFAMYCIIHNVKMPSLGKRSVVDIRKDLKQSEVTNDLLLALNFKEIVWAIDKGHLNFDGDSSRLINDLNKDFNNMATSPIIKNIFENGKEMSETINIIRDKFGRSYVTPVSKKGIIKEENDGNLELENIWKNPRPNNPNTKEIKVGDTVNVDGLEPLQVVERVDGNKILLTGGNGIVDKSKAYPMYVQLTNQPKVGNVVTYNSKVYIVSSITDTLVNTTIGTAISIQKIEKIYDRTESKVSCAVYKCGAIHYNGKKYNCKNSLKREYPDVSFKFDTLDFTLDQKNIAEHYSLSIESVKPKETTMLKLLQEALDHPLNVKVKEWALLVGPSGSGKTELVVDYANRVGKRYIKLQGNAQVTVDDLIGYKSITDGTYFPSLLREAVEEGLVFILDEIDSCNPNTLLTLNGLKQEYFQFPDKLVKINPEFRLVATANTLEYSEEYNSRSPMDKATKARFDVIEYKMEKHELAIRYGLSKIKQIDNIDRLTPREVSRLVTKLMIKEEREKAEIQKNTGEKEAC